MSTIALSDHVRAISHILSTGLDGPVNLTGPEPVRNSEFTTILAAHVRRPAFAHVPAPIIKLAGQVGTDALLASQQVIPARLEDSGFSFEYPTLGEMLDGLG